MSNANKPKPSSDRAIAIVTAYPFVLILIATLINVFAFGVDPIVVAMPNLESIRALVVAITILLINHTWIMNSTELARARYGLHSNAEEWAASNTDPALAPQEGIDEVDMRLNAHRNTTENTVYFVFLSLVFVAVSPPAFATWAWVVGYPVARVGYTYSYLHRKVDLRGLLMSLSLLAMYGMASYLGISLIMF